MTKTKRQLRAEAVERLRECRYLSTSDLMCAMAGFGHEPHTGEQWRDALIDLLEDDDMDSAVYVQKCPNDELSEGDAPSEFAEILMSLAADCSCMGDGIVRHFEPKDVQNDVDALMRVVERDYVRRDGYDFTVEMLSCMKAERDEWKAKAEQATESYADAKDARDTWMSNYLEAKRAMNKAAGKWARADAELRSDDGVTNLEWLYEHDRERILRNLAMEDDPCLICPEFLGGDELCMIEGECSKVLREWFMEPHMDANDVFSGESVVTPEAVDANDSLMDLDSCTHGMRTFASETDSREKLEADVRRWFTGDYYDDYYSNADMCKVVSRWLDRQAAITHSIDAWNIERLEKRIAELQEKVDALTQANGDLRDEWHRVCVERNKLISKLIESERDRESLRAKLGEAVDRAHEIGRLME